MSESWGVAVACSCEIRRYSSSYAHAADLEISTDRLCSSASEYSAVRGPTDQRRFNSLPIARELYTRADLRGWC